jgi:hypothetical protein
MKYHILKILLVLIFAGTVFAGATIYFFEVKSENGDIRIEWRTKDEVNVKHFIIQRRTPNGQFMDIATILPKGNDSHYSYTDESAYKVQDLIFIYRLKIVDKDNRISESQEITVSHSISDVKRTWGSIKAMFR